MVGRLDFPIELLDNRGSPYRPVLQARLPKWTGQIRWHQGGQCRSRSRPWRPPPRAGVQTQTPEERAVRASGHRQPSIDGDLSAMDHAGPLLGFEPQACNENARALISMMARSTNRSNQRPGTLMQDRKAARSTKPLATHGR